MGKFQQRHYEAIADVIYELYLNTSRTSATVGWTINEVENRLIKLFQSDNPRFRESKFREACHRHETLA